MSEVTCPHCGETIRELWDYDWGGNDYVEVECPHCDELITIHQHITYTARGTDDE